MSRNVNYKADMSRAFEFFKQRVMANQPHTLSEVARLLGRPLKTVEKWSSRNGWMDWKASFMSEVCGEITEKSPNDVSSLLELSLSAHVSLLQQGVQDILAGKIRVNHMRDLLEVSRSAKELHELLTKSPGGDSPAFPAAGQVTNNQFNLLLPQNMDPKELGRLNELSMRLRGQEPGRAAKFLAAEKGEDS